MGKAAIYNSLINLLSRKFCIKVLGIGEAVIRSRFMGYNIVTFFGKESYMTLEQRRIRAQALVNGYMSLGYIVRASGLVIDQQKRQVVDHVEVHLFNADNPIKLVSGSFSLR